MQLAKGIYQLSGPFYGNSSSVYGIAGEHNLILIDAGFDETQLAVIDENIRYWGLDKLTLSHVICTHCHFDHVGNAALLRERGVKIVASREDGEAIELGDDRTLGFAFMGKKFKASPVDQKVEDGEILEIDGISIEVISTPGHTAGGICLKVQLGSRTALFTGDTIHVGLNCNFARLGWNGSVDFDSEAYLESIRKLKDLDVDMIFAGHEYNCLKDGRKILQDAYKQALLELRPLPYHYVSTAVRSSIPIF